MTARWMRFAPSKRSSRRRKCDDCDLNTAPGTGPAGGNPCGRRTTIR